MSNITLDRLKGCIIGGALGDALGFPIENQRLNVIRQRYGVKGIFNLKSNSRAKKAVITDDTQMTLFTMEGLINYTKSRIKNKKEFLLSYHRWFYTQSKSINLGVMSAYKGYDIQHLKMKFINSTLLKDDRLLHLRGPGNTCLTSLGSGKYQTFDNIINDSKGCGGVMRVAPVGFYHKDPLKAFILGCEISVLTHGHVLGYVAAGYSAALISYLNEGEELEIAAKKALDILVYEKNDLSGLTDDEKDSYQKITSKDLSKLNSLLLKSIRYAKLSQKDGKNYLKEIGEGWVAEETIAIAIYCALFKKDNFKDALRLAVNHDGDSDSTGSVCGNILGLLYGFEHLPKDWVSMLELVDVIDSMSKSLLEVIENE